MEIIEDIFRASDSGASSVFVLLDYYMAFDSHEILLSVSKFKGFSDDGVYFIKNYLRCRVQLVETTVDQSPREIVFTIYTNNILSCIYYITVYFYADGTNYLSDSEH